MKADRSRIIIVSSVLDSSISLKAAPQTSHQPFLIKLEIISKRCRGDHGFTLMITLLLLVLLTGIAVGMLQLSAVSLRSSTQSAAERIARSNARMALNLAIAQLQRSAGPDQRITAPAHLANPSNPKSWCGVWTPGALAENTLTPAVGLVTTQGGCLVS